MELVLLGILSFGIYKMAMGYQIMPWKWVMRLVVTFVASYIGFCIAIVLIYGQALQKDANKIVEVVTPLMPFILLYEMLLFFFFRSQMLRYVHALDQIDKNDNNHKNTPPPTSPTSPPQEPKDLSYFR